MSYVSFTGLKSDLALQRATGGAIVSARGYGTPQVLTAYQALTRAIASTGAQEQSFHTYSLDAPIKAYATIRSSGQSAAIVNEYLPILLSYDNAEIIEKIDVYDWWNNVTTAVDGAREIELELISALDTKLSTSINRSHATVIALGVSIGFLFALNVWITALTIRHVISVLSITVPATATSSHNTTTTNKKPKPGAHNPNQPNKQLQIGGATVVPVPAMHSAASTPGHAATEAVVELQPHPPSGSPPRPAVEEPPTAGSPDPNPPASSVQPTNIHDSQIHVAPTSMIQVSIVAAADDPRLTVPGSTAATADTHTSTVSGGGTARE